LGLVEAGDSSNEGNTLFGKKVPLAKSSHEKKGKARTRKRGKKKPSSVPSGGGERLSCAVKRKRCSKKKARSPKESLVNTVQETKGRIKGRTYLPTVGEDESLQRKRGITGARQSKKEKRIEHHRKAGGSGPNCKEGGGDSFIGMPGEEQARI